MNSLKIRDPSLTKLPTVNGDTIYIYEFGPGEKLVKTENDAKICPVIQNWSGHIHVNTSNTWRLVLFYVKMPKMGT